MTGRVRTLTDSVTSREVEREAPQLTFDEIFTLHHRVVYRVACSLVRDAALAEDVTQETFLKLYRHFDAVPGEELLRAWLLRVCINTARNALRTQNRRSAREEKFVGADMSCSEISSSVPSAEYERQVEIAKTRKALDCVREPMRSCLLLQQQGLSYREIAHTLALNEASIGSWIARGRKEFVRAYSRGGKT